MQLLSRKFPTLAVTNADNCNYNVGTKLYTDSFRILIMMVLYATDIQLLIS